MSNDISLQKFQAFTKQSLSVGMQYIAEKALAMRLAEQDNARTQTTSLEKDVVSSASKTL